MALMTVVMAVFLFTVIVGALAAGAMGETTLSGDQLRGQRALAVAEAGAYRALADLRRRLSVDLDLQVGGPSVVADEVRNICTGAAGRRNIEIIERFAWPAPLGATDWVRTTGDPDTARLEIGKPAAPVGLTEAATGEAIGTFHATVLIRPSGAPPACQFGAGLPEQEIMWFDFAIRSVGRAGNATRAVCLRSPSADRCPDWFSSPGSWEGSYVITAGTASGWPVLIEVAAAGTPPDGAGSYTAVRYPSPSVVFEAGDPLYDRPQWEEVTGP